MTHRPFTPFTIIMADGKEYRVPSPEWILYPEPGRLCTVYRDRVHVVLDLLTMTGIQYDGGNLPSPQPPADEQEVAA